MIHTNRQRRGRAPKSPWERGEPIGSMKEVRGRWEGTRCGEAHRRDVRTTRLLGAPPQVITRVHTFPWKRFEIASVTRHCVHAAHKS
jgi:hypothetical protein